MTTRQSTGWKWISEKQSWALAWSTGILMMKRFIIINQFVNCSIVEQYGEWWMDRRRSGAHSTCTAILQLPPPPHATSPSHILPSVQPPICVTVTPGSYEVHFLMRLSRCWVLPWSDEPIMSLQLEPAKLSPWQMRRDSKPRLSGRSIGEPAP